VAKAELENDLLTIMPSHWDIAIDVWEMDHAIRKGCGRLAVIARGEVSNAQHLAVYNISALLSWDTLDTKAHTIECIITTDDALARTRRARIRYPSCAGPPLSSLATSKRWAGRSAAARRRGRELSLTRRGTLMHHTGKGYDRTSVREIQGRAG